jgi:hypothetical protein
MAKINDGHLRTMQVTFNKLKEYDNISVDTRFTEVLIKILHLGRNYNGSVFKKDIVENAFPSLANIPILGFIESNKDGDDDFSDHRTELIKENGNMKMRYMGNCYGVIPESFAKDAYFQNELCSDGIEREFLFVKGLLFNKFDYVLDIFNDENNDKSQSMELDENYEGHWENDGFVFDKFKFAGSCILGKGVQPAMSDSDITMNFSTKSVAEEIENKLNEFAKYFSKKEEENNMAKKKTDETEEQFEEKDIENLAKKESTESEEAKVEEPEVENNSKNDSETKVFAEGEGICPKCGNDPCTCEDDFAKDEEKVEEEMACGDKDKENMSKEDGKKEYTLKFSLSFEDIKCQIYDKLYEMERIENTCYAIISTNDNYFKYLDYCTGQFFKQSYVKTDDSITFTGEREEIFNVFVDKETKDAITSVTYSKLQQNLDEANAKIQEYSKANEELLKFQLDIKENERKQEIDTVISRFSKVNELDLENYKQKAYNKEISKDDLEIKLYAELGKMNFSKIAGEVEEEKVDAPINYSVSLQEQDKCPYAGCEGLFSN